jgi:hypothetical protein
MPQLPHPLIYASTREITILNAFLGKLLPTHKPLNFLKKYILEAGCVLIETILYKL